MTPEGRAKAQAEYDKARAALYERIAACRYCKVAAHRASGNPRKPEHCRKHQSEMRLIYVTSPISETYWSS